MTFVLVLPRFDMTRSKRYRNVDEVGIVTNVLFWAYPM
jgi:hypothetical protein